MKKIQKELFTDDVKGNVKGINQYLKEMKDNDDVDVDRLYIDYIRNNAKNLLALCDTFEKL